LGFRLELHRLDPQLALEVGLIVEDAASVDSASPRLTYQSSMSAESAHAIP
jgi:hypothetical protein